MFVTLQRLMTVATHFFASEVQANPGQAIVYVAFLPIKIAAHPYRATWVNQASANALPVLLCPLSFIGGAFDSLGVDVAATPVSLIQSTPYGSLSHDLHEALVPGSPGTTEAEQPLAAREARERSRGHQEGWRERQPFACVSAQRSTTSSSTSTLPSAPPVLPPPPPPPSPSPSPFPLLLLFCATWHSLGSRTRLQSFSYEETVLQTLGLGLGLSVGQRQTPRGRTRARRCRVRRRIPAPSFSSGPSRRPRTRRG